MSMNTATKCFKDNIQLTEGDPEKYNHYNGLALMASGDFYNAKRCFEENIKLFSQSNDEKFNLYNGLFNFAESMEK